MSYDFDPRLSQFESILWANNIESREFSETPAITPGLLSSCNAGFGNDGTPVLDGVTSGVHFKSNSYAAWSGQQNSQSMKGNSCVTPSTGTGRARVHAHKGASSPTETGWMEDGPAEQIAPPFGLEHIAAMTNQIREVFGFQRDVGINVFELLMSQLDSRASRQGPQAALRSLHGEYISGVQSNFRKWYFAAQMDRVDRQKNKQHRHSMQSVHRYQVLSENNAQKFDFGQVSLSPDLQVADISNEDTEYDPGEEEEEDTLRGAEAMWDFHFMTCSDEDRLVDILIYLFCWSEANQVRFMPELLAFIVKCARDYYKARFPAYPQSAREVENLEPCFFLDKIITPIYNCYRSFNYEKNKAGDWIRREGDHNDFIGYDDINQLFWYRDGLRRLKLRQKTAQEIEWPPSWHDGTPRFNDANEIDGEQVCLIDMRPENWFLAIPAVSWESSCSKTYKELRSWLHNITNFSRIWILHASVFWFYTAFNTPSLYTAGYNYMNPIPPCAFVRWTIISLGGLFGPAITLVGLIGEWRFVPRNYAGAKPLLFKLLAVGFLILLLTIPAVCNLALNPWTYAEDVDRMPANVISFVLFGLALIYTAYFSFQPLQNIFSDTRVGMTSKKSDDVQRKFLANRLFTASFPERNAHGAMLSWLMCLLIFAAKFTESYFFLTLSVRDPLRELGIMNLQDKCVGDKYVIGSFLCYAYPKIILAVIIMTDMTLFFLDTYLWYVILNTLISVSIAFEQGTSVWTPWRNVYSQLPQRISTKLLAPRLSTKSYPSRANSICIIWNSIIESMHRNNLLNREQAIRLMSTNAMTQEPRYFTVEVDGKALRSATGYYASGAYRRISFFAQSLSTAMQPAVAVKNMPSFTVLIPHYNEKMILGLSETIKAETGAKITVLEYLQRLYPREWDNFVQALNQQTRLEDNSTDSASPGSTACSVSAKSPYAMKSPFSAKSFYSASASPARSPARSTASTQYGSLGSQSVTNILKPAPSMKSSISTSSTVRSNKSHRIAIQKLGFSTLDRNDTDRTRLWCSERTQTLYRTLRGFSNYTDALKILQCAEEYADASENARTEKALREIDDICRRKFRLLVAMQLYASFTWEQLQEVETILAYVPELVVTYIEHDPETGNFFSCLFDSSCPVLENGRRQPKSRIKLSGNPILGDGKSDNQNMALPYYRGEYIQLVDANQDNYLEECLKIRNVLMEFEAGQQSSGSNALSTSTPSSPALSLDLEACAGVYTGYASVLDPGPAPIAIVGAREYIFSENIGVLGDVAAGKEQTFGTLFSRTLAKIGAKLHYGHPDFLNAIFMTTRGGVSKGQRGLHLNEDIYAGMTAVLRGGQIRHTEYFQCGKGRDLGFVSILNFTSKIGAGMAEQMLSREYFYMGTQLPFDRFIAFYYAHPGFHLNNALIMLSLKMLLVVILWTNSIASVSTVCKYDRHHTLPTEPHLPAGCNNVLPLLDWMHRCVVSIFLVFFVSLCPLLFQELTEKGFVKSLGRIARHFCSLSMLFEVFVCRIYARSFWEDMNVGGAKYVATGRGLATSRLPFYRLYSGYYSEIVSGLEAAGMLMFASICIWNPGYLWFWVTTFSLCFCPVLYNPHQFAFTDFFLDYRKTLYWFWNATSTSTSRKIGQDSWSSFNREVREKLTGVRDRHISSQSTRPAFKNALYSKLGSALLTVQCLGIPYLFMGSQKTSRYQETPEASPLLRIVLVAVIPVGMNMVSLILGLVLSIMIHAVFNKTKHANIVAMIVHTLSLLGLVLSWWVLYVLESCRFAPTLLGIMSEAALHHFLHTLLTICFVRRQRNRIENNDPWWSGNWQYTSVRRLLKMPLVVTEEFIVKMMETLEYAYDFLVVHTILVLQTPLLLLPCIDKLHTLFLLWLKPSVTAAASKSISSQRKKDLIFTSRLFCGLFILIAAFLTVLVTFPLYAPTAWLDSLTDMLEPLADW